jgi:threonine dehydrogenase-like Zn-dependent dehydrogenase
LSVIAQDVGEEVVKIQNAMGSGIDVSFDCVGFDKTTSTALNATRSGGKVCLIGLAKSEIVAPQILIVLFFIYLFDNIIQLISLRNLWYYGGW